MPSGAPAAPRSRPSPLAAPAPPLPTAEVIATTAARRRSLPVAAGAVLLPDPIIPVPLLWAIYHMRGHLKNRLAIGLLAASSVTERLEGSPPISRPGTAHPG